MNAPRVFLLVALALVALVALRDVVRLGDALPWRQLYDFADFYCAGAALDQGADPYRYEPLRRCEHAVNTGEAYRTDPNRVVPAPLPPYDFPPFMLAARLNFTVARTFDALAIVAAVAAAAAGLAMLGLPLEVAALALLFPAGYVLLGAGQLVPFALVALVFCGVALRRARFAGAGILAALTLAEPHLGIPVCVALLVWVPRSRLALVAAGLALAALGAAVTGIGGIDEFVRRVLPAQAAAEASYAYQYSLTYVLTHAGLPAGPAVALGELSYAGMTAAGIWLARRTWAATGRIELVAFLPGACSVIAGPYVHMVDLPFAIPASLVLAWSLDGFAQACAIAATALLAVPWITVWIAKKLFAATLVAVALLLLRLRAGLTFAIAAFAAIAVAIYALELAPPAAMLSMTPAGIAPAALAQTAWAATVAHLVTTSPLWLLVKVPTWIALGALLTAALAASRTPSTDPRT